MYPAAIEAAFGADVDYAQLIKIYGPMGDAASPDTRYSPGTCRSAVVERVAGDPDPEHINTSYVERQNLNMRMGIRRFTRLTNAFSKKLASHACHVALWTTWYNFCRIHTTTGVSPAMAAGVTDRLRDVRWLAGLVAATPPPGPRGPYRKTRRRRA